VPSDTPAHKLRDAISTLGEEAWRLRKSYRRRYTVIIHAMRDIPSASQWRTRTRHVWRRSSPDRSIVLARALRQHWKDQRHVGILLRRPSPAHWSRGCAPVRETSVNLNYTVGKSGLEAAVRSAGLATIVTAESSSRRPVDLPDGPSNVCEEFPPIGTGQKLVASLLALCAPARLIERACGQNTR